MTTQTQKRLDPKLRRLVASIGDERRLRFDLARATVAATEDVPVDAEEVGAEALEKRVLVRLTSQRRPEGFEDLEWHEIVPGIYSVAVPVTRLEQLASDPRVEYVEAGRLLGPMLKTSILETRADRVRNPAPPATGLDGTGVVVGIIDFGLDFTLDDFREADGSTRVAFLWDQALDAQPGDSVPRFGYGVEYDRGAIDQALAAADPFDEVRHRPDPASHGTHVAGIAAANGRSGDADFTAGEWVGAAPGATLVFVQPAADDQSTTFTDSVHVAEAVAYVFEKAAELGMPCVINMSLGQNGGSHDGESVVERAIDRLLERPGRAMTVAAGNEHIWRGHAGGTLSDGEVRDLRWKFGGGLPLPGGGQLSGGFGDFSPNEMEIWYSPRDRFSVRVIAPDGEASPPIAPGETAVHDFAGGETLFVDSERFTVLNGEARIYLEVAPPSVVGGRVSTGVWRVEVTADEVRDGRFDAWIERDVRRSSNRFADQSFFEGADFDGARTLGTPATTRRAVSVANYDHVGQAPNDSSGRGTTRDGRTKPEVAAPGTGILASHSLGGRPDGNGGTFPMRTPMSGTSMAAPHVAGIVALLLERSPTLSAPQITQMLVASCREPAGVTVFDPAWGFGQVDAEACAALL